MPGLPLGFSLILAAFALFLFIATASYRYLPATLFLSLRILLPDLGGFQGLILAGLALFLVLGLVLPRLAWPAPLALAGWAGALGIGLAWLGMQALYVQARVFSMQPIPGQLEGAAVFASCLAFLLAAWGSTRRPWLLALAGLASCLMMQALAIRAFPLDSGFSDLLLAVREGGGAFLQGHYPYGEFSYGAGKALHVYLPLTWMPYLPALALGLDPRWMNLAFLGIFTACSYLSFPQHRRLEGAALLALFLVNPWLQFRHEAYIPACLALLSLHALALTRARSFWAAATLGLALAAYQFFWLLGPLFAARVLKREGLISALKHSLLALAILAIFILPFWIWDPSRFPLSLIAVTKGNVEAGHFNLIHWLPGLAALLQPAQLLFLGLAAWRLHQGEAGLRSYFGWSTASLAFFMIANFYTQHYFFLLVAALMLYFLPQVRSDASIRSLINEP